MAKATLPVNYKDDILASGMNGKRRYNLVQNSDGTFCLEDVTTYTQVGSNFGAANVNAISGAVNAAADASKIIDNVDDILALTQSGYMMGGLAGKKLISDLSCRYKSDTDMIQVKLNGVWTDAIRAEVNTRYVYHYGTEYDLLASCYTSFHNTFVALTKNTSDLKMYINDSAGSWNPEAAFGTVNQIDLSGYSLIEADCKNCVFSNGNNAGYIKVGTARGDGGMTSVTKQMDWCSNGTYTAVLDISDITGKQYIDVGIKGNPVGVWGGNQYTGTATIYITAIRLIK